MEIKGLLRTLSIVLFLIIFPSRAFAEDASVKPIAALSDGEEGDEAIPDGGSRRSPDAGVRGPESRLRVGVAGSPPFVIRDGSSDPSGISIDIWKDVADTAGIDIGTFVSLPSVPLAIEALARGEVDVLVGPVSITAERAERVRFTQPYFHSTIGILARPGAGSSWNRVAPFFSKAFAVGVGVLLGVLLVVGALVWLVERKANGTHFPKHPLPGIANGIWFALVTMTTVGYGDRAPVTVAGRVISGIWMVIALVSASSLTAGIATTLTLSRLDTAQLDSAAKLANRPVLAVPGTPGASFAKRLRARVIDAKNVEDGAQRVAAGEADAFVFDRPMLIHHMGQHPELDVVLARASYLPQGYGFALPLKTKLLSRLNVALLREAESGRTKRTCEAWLGHDGDEEEMP